MKNNDNMKYFDANGKPDDDRIKREIDTIIEQDEFSVSFDGLYALMMPVAALLLFGIILFCNELFLQSHNSPGMMIGLVVFVVLLICDITIPLLLFSNQLIDRTENKIETFNAELLEEYNCVYNDRRYSEMEAVNDYCRKCLEIREGNVLNSYNLFTYDQILKIEERVGNSPGKNRAVFSYSTYRDDGDDVGVAEAEEIVSANKKKGVKYYEIFYSDPVESTVHGDDNEVFVNLSEILKEGIERCLDYRFYKDCRFDIMIYQWDDNNVEGYFCLNFPLIKECTHDANCPIKCTLSNTDRTKKVFYKKMVPSVTVSLHQRLKRLAEMRINSDG